MTSFYYHDQNPSGFFFLVQFRVLLFKPRWDYQFKYDRKNEKDFGLSSKVTPSCKWPSLIGVQGSKLTLANSQNASDFDNLRVKKMSTNKRLRGRIIHVSQTKGKNLLVVPPVC